MPGTTNRTNEGNVLTLFMAEHCPYGWKQAQITAGRFLVGLPAGGTPDEFSRRLRGEIDKWALVIRTAGIKPE